MYDTLHNSSHRRLEVGARADRPRHRAIAMLRLALVIVLSVSIWTAAQAKAQPSIEYLMVPSAAMSRDIPVAFQGGGPHAVILLDAFNAVPDVSNWVTAGKAMNTLAGKGISVAVPAGGAWSFYTDWEQDGSRQWETFLASELRDWLAANKGMAPGGHGIVGAAQGGTGALMMATFHPDRYRYAHTLLDDVPTASIPITRGGHQRCIV